MDKRISAAQVAQIWNERARSEHGIEANYSRFSVRGRREELGGEETELGWLFSEQKAREVSLRPRSNKRPDVLSRRETAFKRKGE